MKRALIAILALVPAVGGANPNPEVKTPGPQSKVKPAPESLGPPSKAVTNEILDIIAAKMHAAENQLNNVIPGAPPLYHLSYKITEVDVNDVAASLGNVTTRRNRHFVNLEVRVRVGKPDDFDNGNFVVPEAGDIDGAATATLPLEPSGRIARRAASNATEQAYKEALIQWRAKMEARRAGHTRASNAPAWTAEKPVVSEEPVLVAALESVDEIEARAKAVSAVFRDQPELRDSRVAITSYLERRWYLTTEGTSVADTRRASGILIAASGQADDGELLHQYFLRYGHTAKDLPSDDELKAESKLLGKRIVELAKAPVLDDDYDGPVLFEGEGAVGFVRVSLAPHLGGTPVPEGMAPQDAKQFGGALVRKVGLRVLAPFLSVIDDPTAKDAPKDAGGKALIGGYKIDDEGVAAQRVEVIKDGVLKTLLTSRTPSQKGQKSNGHARRPGDNLGGAFHGSATNLRIVGRGGLPRKALEQRLIAAARAENLKYGLVIRQFDDAAITGNHEFTRRELVQMFKTADQQLPPPALLAYRLYPNGKEELVRGAQMADVPVRAWKDMIAVGNQPTVYNFLAATESQLALRIGGGTDDGFVPSGGVESSVTTPDLLVRELDVFGRTSGVRSAPAVPKPGK